MGWRTKSRIQNAVGLLPPNVGHKIYYLIQRRFGRLKQVTPIPGLASGLIVCRKIVEQGGSPAGKTFLEVGTGWRVNMPIALWLLGADKVITVDLNPYMQPELVEGDIDYIAENASEIKDMLAGSSLDVTRFDALVGLAARRWRMDELLDLCCIDYIAPGDATNLSLPSASVDFHTSYNVIEHVAPEVLRGIIREGNRIVRDGGLFIHRVDYSDHFAHIDDSISFINFLQYSDGEWERLAGNRYAYANRLRVDDIEKLYQECNQTIVSIESTIDPPAAEQLKDPAFRLDKKFAGKSHTVLTTIDSWIVSTKSGGTSTTP